MPYAFSRDERTLLFLDGHGLTRIPAKGRPRNAPKVACGAGAIVTVDDDARRCIVWDPYQNRYHTLTVADLAVETFGATDLALLSPDGDDRVWATIWGFHHVGEAPCLERHAWPEPRATDLALGPDGPPRDALAQRWHRTPEGDFARMMEHGGEAFVYAGSTHERPWRCADAWRITLRGDGLTRVYATPRGATVAVHDQRSERAHIASVSATRPTESFALATRCLPARRGAQWLTQRDDHTLVAVDRHGAELDRWTLPREFAGAGELVVGARRALWCAPDGASLFDLDTKVALSRALPAATEPFRPLLASSFARLNAAGAPHGRRFDLRSLKSVAGGKIAQFTLTMTPGDRSFASWALGAMADNRGAWAWPLSLFDSAASDRGSFVGPIDAPSVRALLTLADRAALSLVHLAPFLWMHFEMARLRWCCWRDETREVLLTREGATLLLRAMMVHLASPRHEAPPPVSARFDEAEITPLTLDEAKTRIAAIDPSQRHAYENLMVVALALEALPVEDAAPLVAWCDAHITRDQYHPFWDGWKRLCARVA